MQFDTSASRAFGSPRATTRSPAPEVSWADEQAAKRQRAGSPAPDAGGEAQPPLPGAEGLVDITVRRGDKTTVTVPCDVKALTPWYKAQHGGAEPCFEFLLATGDKSSFSALGSCTKSGVKGHEKGGNCHHTNRQWHEHHKFKFVPKAFHEALEWHK